MKATLFTAAAFLNPGVALAQEEQFYEEEELDFSFGDNCEKLEDLSNEAVQLLAIAVEGRDVDRFCAVSDPLDCGDYNWTIELFGVLTPAKHKGYCRLIPEPTPQREVPSLPHRRA